MSAITGLLRDDLRGFMGYSSARSQALDGTVWLNANESPWPNHVDPVAALRRYPDPQPHALREALASHYECKPNQLLIGRGSDEAIDLLVRALCVPGRDAVLVTPPVFGMYGVCTRLQGAHLVEVPLQDSGTDFAVDLQAVGACALAQGAKLVFLCSPGNPAGGVLGAAEVLGLAQRLQGHALVVVDEAYIEYADAPSLVPLVAQQANLAVLRTLSKAHALPAARIGCLIAEPALIDALRRCQAPYPVPGPCAQLALQAFAPDALVQTSATVAATCQARAHLLAALPTLPGVRRVYPSQANFLLVRFECADLAFARLLAAGVVVRDMRALPQLQDALRITVGTPAQNARVVSLLGSRSDVGAVA